MQKKYNGFTLIEMMIVVAIVAVLASIAYASYQSSITKSRRSDARDALMRTAALQEKHYLQFNQYTITMDLIGGDTSIEEYYSIGAAFTIAGSGDCGDTDDRQCFTLTATTQGAQAQDDLCASYTLDNLGRRAAVDGSNNDTTDLCW